MLSSHSSRRRLVVPQSPPDSTANKPPPGRGDQLDLLGDKDDAPAPRKRWAWLLAHIFAADVETCPSHSQEPISYYGKIGSTTYRVIWRAELSYKLAELAKHIGGPTPIVIRAVN